MKITLDKPEAERLLAHYFYLKLDEDIERVEISDMEPIREVHSVTYTSLMVQDLWSDLMQPSDKDERLATVKIRMMKFFMGLHLKLTGYPCSLINAKNFIESHKTF
jgi:hypothetical protein